MTTLPSILSLLVAYLIGSIPFAVVVSHLLGLDDPRSYGSGNPGATNVLRGGSKLAALLTLLGDAAKGGLVVWTARMLAPQMGFTPEILAGIAIAVFLGHVFSIFLAFKGGKGVATAGGVLFGIQPLLGLTCLVVWLVVAMIARYSSLASVAVALVAPLLAHLVNGQPMWVATTVILGAILIWRHAENIRRLISGTEGKLGKKKAT